MLSYLMNSIFKLTTICNVHSIIPEAWNVHTVIVMLQYEFFVQSVVALPRLAHHCALFTFVYILPCKSLNGILFIKQYFQIKRTTICNVYSIIPEAWNIHACKYIQACGIHMVTQLTWKNTRECSGNSVAILDYWSRFLMMP